MSIICIETVYTIIWKGVKVMLKKVFAVSMVLVLALGACGEGKEETVSRGLLSRDEIERMESLYFADTDAALEGMGLSKEDLENYGSSTSAGSYLLKAPRSIGGEYFRQAVLTSIAAPEGLFGMSFRATFDDQEEAESARDALRDVAAELYGAQPALLRLRRLFRGRGLPLYRRPRVQHTVGDRRQEAVRGRDGRDGERGTGKAKAIA